MLQASEAVNRVTEALLRDPRTQGSLIDVSDQGGVVTLSGMAPSQVAKEAAEEVALQQQGVLAVINELSIRADGDKDPLINPLLPH
jgi:osmotically-inducible protein OsmY